MIQSTNGMCGKKDTRKVSGVTPEGEKPYRLRILMLPMPESILIFIRPVLLA